ncbi:MAG: flavodoxin domain-containing protein, partial [Gammaproteobacteria bacterium]
MHRIGIFFGTESGTTRLISKKIMKAMRARLGNDHVPKPLNINRAVPDEFLSHSFLVLGTPTYSDGMLPGREAKLEDESWAEFLPKIEGQDLSGTRVALFGCGDQEEYPDHFQDGMGHLYEFFTAAGAELIGGCSTQGYSYNHSRAVIDDRFVGLAIDQHLQHLK